MSKKADKFIEKYIVGKNDWLLKHKEVISKLLDEYEQEQLTVPVVVKANPKKICELIRQKFDGWVFGIETQAGEKLKVVDSTDFNEIITEIENELKQCKK